MGATNIGPLTLKVTANADGMTAQLGKAAQTLSKWSSSLSKSTPIPGLGKNGIIAKLTTAAGEAFANPLRAVNNAMVGGAASIIEQVPFVGAALAAPLRVLQGGINFGLDAYAEASDRIIQLGKGAAKTGMSVQNFQAFSILVDGAEKADRAMFKFQQSLADAKFAAVGARSKFDDLGLDGKALADLYATDATAAFSAVGQRLREMGHPALQAHAAMELFGKSGKDMLPALLGVGKSIEEIKADMDRFGLAIDGGLVKSVKEAQKAGKEIKMLWEGFSNQIVVAFAPIMAEIASRIGPLKIGFKGMGDTIINVVGGAAIFVADVIDGWSDDNFADKMAPYWDEFKTKAGETIDWIGDRIDSKIGRSLGRSLLDTFVPAGSGDAASEGFAAGWNHLFGKKKKDKEDEIDWDEWDWGEKKAGKARKTVEEMIESVRNRMKGLGGDGDKGAADLFEPYRKRALILRDSVKGPLGAFRDSMGELASVMGAIDAEQAKSGKDFSSIFSRGDAALAAFKSIQGVMGAAPEKKFAGAVMRDSTEAYSAIVNHQFGDQNKSVQERIRDGIAELNAQQADQVRIGQETLDFLRDNPGAMTMGGV